VPILVTGFSTRAIAESAARNGHTIVALDYFGDRDQRVLVENHALLRDFDQPYSARALLRASRGLDFGAVVYGSNLENHPGVVEELARGRALLGNTPAALRQVRDWRVLRAFCRDEGILCPTTLLPGEEAGADPALRWLCKPVRSGGGHGIRPWPGAESPHPHRGRAGVGGSGRCRRRPRTVGRTVGFNVRNVRLDDEYVLQAYVPGRAASAAFVADGRRSVVIGLTEQLIGREELGARGFGWCGNVLPLAAPPQDRMAVLEAVERMAARLTRRFGLRGVNGIDLVVADGVRGRPDVFLIEVNPRYTASMELIERAYGLNIFALHLEAVGIADIAPANPKGFRKPLGFRASVHASMEGRLPDFSLARLLGSGGTYVAKGIVYARRAVTMPETAEWVDRGRRDVPFPGERIEAGHPICTVLAEGRGREACWSRLLAGVEAVRREVGDVADRCRSEATEGCTHSDPRGPFGHV